MQTHVLLPREILFQLLPAAFEPWAWDTAAPCTNGEYPLVCFHFDTENPKPISAKPLATDFANHFDAFVGISAPRCPVKALRRRTKRLLSPFTF